MYQYETDLTIFFAEKCAEAGKRHDAGLIARAQVQAKVEADVNKALPLWFEKVGLPFHEDDLNLQIKVEYATPGSESHPSENVGLKFTWTAAKHHFRGILEIPGGSTEPEVQAAIYIGHSLKKGERAIDRDFRPAHTAEQVREALEEEARRR